MPSRLDDEQWLHKGWDWLEGHADHDPLPEQYVWLEEEWLKRLRQYEEAYRLVNEPIRRQPPVAATPTPDVLPRTGEHRQSSF